MERVRRGGFEDVFLELTRVLLSQRPNNHEAWEELGVVYERRGEYDEAWLCYDQAESVFPNSTARERFKQRMESMVGGSDGVPWIVPSISDRAAFLDRLGSLSKHKREIEDEIIDEIQELGTFSKIDGLREEGKITEAFFLARRMAAEGTEGAAEKVAELLQEMER